MVPREPWFQREFVFNLPVSAAPGLIERLRGTPARLHHRLRDLPPARLTVRLGNRSSIQENAGHLWDLEPLWMARLEDLAAGRATLRPADLDNRKTDAANHNARPLPDILADFAAARSQLVAQFEAADEADWLRSARHPRLNTPMRLLDLAQFVAEHDDHHLATITELLRWIP
ncbi:MAG TPA: DinB family protein [Gemmatimonadales bacterium]|nr:DinB family protein [Gemmatimonadales bacterium]